MYVLNDIEFNKVSSLPAEKRFSYCIKRIVDSGIIWSLYDNGWALIADDLSEEEIIPIWSHSRFAEVCATGEWEGYKPRRISLKNFIRKWIPGMIKDKRVIAVFFVPDGTYVHISPEELFNRLEEELEQYE